MFKDTRRPMGCAPDQHPERLPREMLALIVNGQMGSLEQGDNMVLQGLEGSVLATTLALPDGAVCVGGTANADRTGAFLFYCCPDGRLRIVEWLQSGAASLILDTDLLDCYQGRFPERDRYVAGFSYNAEVLSGHLLWTVRWDLEKTEAKIEGRPGRIEIEYWREKTARGISPIYAHQLTLARKPPLYAPVIDVSGGEPIGVMDGSGGDGQNLPFEPRGTQMAFRYQYVNGELSSLSPWSRVWHGKGLTCYMQGADARELYDSLGQALEVTHVLVYARYASEATVLKVGEIEVKQRLTDVEFAALQTQGTYLRYATESRKDMTGPALDTDVASLAFYAVPDKAKALLSARGRVLLGGISEPKYNFPFGLTLSHEVKKIEFNELPPSLGLRPEPVVSSGSEFWFGIVGSDAFGKRSFIEAAQRVVMPERQASYSVYRQVLAGLGTAIRLVDERKRREFYDVDVSLICRVPDWCHRLTLVRTKAKNPYFLEVGANVLYWYKRKDGEDFLSGYRIHLDPPDLQFATFEGIAFAIANDSPYVFEPGQTVYVQHIDAGISINGPANEGLGVLKPGSVSSRYTPDDMQRVFTVDRYEDGIIYVKFDTPSKSDLFKAWPIIVYEPKGRLIPDNLDSTAGVVTQVTLQIRSKPNPNLNKEWYEVYDIPCRPGEYISRTFSQCLCDAFATINYIRKRNERYAVFFRDYAQYDVDLGPLDNNQGTEKTEMNVRINTWVESTSPLEVARVASWDRSFGFAAAERPTGPEPRGFGQMPSTVCFSNPIVSGTRINGISEFLPANREDMPRAGGWITALARGADDSSNLEVMLAIQERAVVSVYLGVAQLQQGDGNTLRSNTSSFIGTSRTLLLRSGTVDPTSVFTDGRGRIYYYDRLSGEGWVRYGGDGQTSLNKTLGFNCLVQDFGNGLLLGWAAGRESAFTEAVLLDTGGAENNALAVREVEPRAFMGVRQYRQAADKQAPDFVVRYGPNVVALCGANVWRLDGGSPNVVLGTELATVVEAVFAPLLPDKAHFHGVVAQGKGFVLPCVVEAEGASFRCSYAGQREGEQLFGILMQGARACKGRTAKVRLVGEAGKDIRLASVATTFTRSMGRP